MNRLLALARKELLQVARDRLTLAMMVMLPVVGDGSVTITVRVISVAAFPAASDTL